MTALCDAISANASQRAVASIGVHRQPAHPLELENRLTKLETTVSNFRWFLAVGLAVVGLGMPLVIYALESSRLG